MKKSMLCAGLMTILSATVYAEDSSRPMNVNAGPSTPASTQLKQEIASDALQTPTVQNAPAQGKQFSVIDTQASAIGVKLAAANKQTATASTATPVNIPTPAASTTAPVTDTPTPVISTPTTPATSATTPATSTTTPTTSTTTPATSVTTPATSATTPATSATTSATSATTSATSATTSATSAPTPATGATTPATSTTSPAANAATPATGTAKPATSTTTPTATLAPPQPLNCNYRIPAETAHIEQTIVMKWAEKAAEQSFDFDHNDIDNQLSTLKSCYTEQGWQGFNDALQKSGNLNAIKSQQLVVSSMVNGESKVMEIKDNQWKVIIPMQVVYQNDKEKLTQPLTVNLVVGRKISGDLGIMQMIAIPRQTATSNSEGSQKP